MGAPLSAAVHQVAPESESESEMYLFDPHKKFISRVATPISSTVNLLFVRSVLFFDMEVIIWVYSIDVF